MSLQTRIERKLKELKPLLGLAGWECKIVMHAAPSEADKDQPYEEQAALSVEPQPNYLRFILNVYPKFERRIKERPYNFDLYLVHELCHIVLSDYDELLEKVLAPSEEHYHTMIAEKATEQFARAILRAAGKYELDF